MIEKRELYTKERIPSGIIINKGDEIPHGLYEMMVSIFIMNDNNEFLIQKRSKEKGGLWAAPAGHPKAGESCELGIVNEVEEEMGLYIQLDELELIEETIYDKKMGCLFFIKENLNLANCILQEEEVDSVRWASIDEIQELIENKQFHKSHCLLFESCLNYLNNRMKKVI